MNHADRFNAPPCVGLKVLETRASGRAHVELVHMRRRRGAFARLAVAWALAASASPAVRTDDGAPRARNATAAAARSLGASFHVELADGRLSASVATLLPAARSVLVVDVEDVIRDFAREGRYDVLYGVRGGAAARALWRAGAASFLLGNGSALPLAEFAADRAGKE